MCKLLFFLLVLGCIGGLVTVSLRTPLIDREWSLDQALLPTAQISGDEVQIKNVRNFLYASTTEYEARYYDATVKLSELERVDYIVEPFGSVGAAHTFLSFGFVDGQQIAISVEIRKQVGESFSPVRGLLNEYELMYVIADERDVINLRANHRQNDIYVYPTSARPEDAQALFVSMLTRANQLAEKPEFYNTFTNNCTTNIVDHINEIVPNRIGFDFRLVLPEHSDALAQEIGFIAAGMTLQEARQQYQVNTKARKFQNDADFSKKIREDWPTVSDVAPAPLYEVVTVLDGDTIEVLMDGSTKRVRYIGIDAPEAYPPDQVECFAGEATNRNRELVVGKKVRLEKDTREVDDYNRLLRYVYVDELFINETLVAEGLARAKAYPPDVARTATLEAAEVIAKEQESGIWGRCDRYLGS